MTDFPNPELEWYEVFNDGETQIEAAEIGPGCLISPNLGYIHFIPNVRIEPQTGDMDRARLVAVGK